VKPEPYRVPKVTVLVPIFNAEPFLRESLNSVFAQTFRDFELLAIDDGSTDGSHEVLSSFHDSRLRMVNNSANRGLIFTLNRGLELAEGEYVARLDADDIAMPERLDRQVAFLDSRPAIALIGSFAEFIDPEGAPFLIQRVPLTFDDIIRKIFSSNCFVHPSVMFRTSVVRELGGFREEMLHAEDYDLWLRVIERHGVANLPEPLVRYRVHPGQLSQRKLRLQRAIADRCRFEALARCRRTGRVPVGVSAERPTFWDRLRGRALTVGGDHLVWMDTYRAMGRHDLADALIWPALASAPFSRRLHRALAGVLFRAPLVRKLRHAFDCCRRRALSVLRGD
jgi:glycosyltransferase involved in cell wall biosynthesis